MCTLLPSMQFAMLHSVQPDGKQIFITAAGKLVCPHGECPSTICYWIREERIARKEGIPLPLRGGSRGLSTCNCQNTDGLNAKSDNATHLPARPSSLFDFLEKQGEELVIVKGRHARRIPHLPGPTFVTTTGQLCCRHGASRLSLNNKLKARIRPSVRLPTCGCNLKPLPVRGAGLAVMKNNRKICKVSPRHSQNATQAEACVV